MLRGAIGLRDIRIYVCVYIYMHNIYAYISVCVYSANYSLLSFLMMAQDLGNRDQGLERLNRCF